MTRRPQAIAVLLLAVLLAVGTVAVACTGAARNRGSGAQPTLDSSPPAVALAPGASGSASASGSPAASASASAGAAATTGGQGPTGASVAGNGGWWRPRTGLRWQWQLTGTLNMSVAVDVYDIDAFTTGAADVAKLHAAGRHVICYVNVGAYEDFRADANRFPASVRGRELDGWPGERWLDIRRWDLLQPILAARFAMCRQKGFDAVEPDNVDGYANESGFPLTAADQVVYNRRIAELAHGYGLAVGLKNDVEQAATLASAFDFAVNEECVAYRECELLRVFPAAGKPVFHVEYDLPTSQFCPVTRPLGFSSMRKKKDLDAWREAC